MDHDIHWVIEVQAQVEDSIRASGNQPDPTEVWEAVKRETKVGAAQTRFKTQKYPETNPMLSQGLKLSLPGTSSARKKPAPGEARKNLEHRTFHGLTCVIDHPESWQEDEEDPEFAKIAGLQKTTKKRWRWKKQWKWWICRRRPGTLTPAAPTILERRKQAASNPSWVNWVGSPMNLRYTMIRSRNLVSLLLCFPPFMIPW